MKLNEICSKGKSSLRQKDVINDGPYSVYGASGVVGTTSDYQNEIPYVAVVKDGAGVGRANACEPMTSVLGTMQALIPNPNVERDYLLHLVRSLRLGEGFSGSTIPHIYFKDYGKIEVPLPSLEAQKRIVSQLGLIETQIEQTEAQIAQFDQLVKSRFVEMFGGSSNEMLLRWPTKKLDDCVESIDSGKSPNCRSESRQGNKPAVLKLSALSSGIFLAGENKVLPEGEEIPSDKEIRKGDILVARKNTPELVGACVLVKEDISNLMFPDLVFRMHPFGNVEGSYLSALLSVSPFAAEVKLLAHGSAKSMSNIPKSELKKLMLPIPPLELQQEFAFFVQQVDKLKYGGPSDICPIRVKCIG